MKHPISSTIPNIDSTWLARFDSTTLLANLLDLSKSLAFYIVDNTQHVLYWSEGMEVFTGLRQEDIIGKRCPEDCMIDVGSNDRQRVVTLSKANGNKIELMLVTQILHDTKGTFAGGISILTDVAEPSPDLFQLQPPVTSKQNFHGIISRSPSMRDVFQIIQNAAETEATVLVRGESGAGKELVAKAIHLLSTRHKGPFLAINCAALSSNLLESELFGHARGAFTGAIKDHSGLFQRASGGTLFLDEVAELPLDL